MNSNKEEAAKKFWVQAGFGTYYRIQAAVGAKLQATNRVPRPVDRGTATRYGG